MATVTGSVSQNSKYFTFYLEYGLAGQGSGYSTVYVETYIGTSTTQAAFDGNASWSVSCNGDSRSGSGRLNSVGWTSGNPMRIQRETFTVYHSGATSIYISGAANCPSGGYGFGSASAGGYLSLPATSGGGGGSTTSQGLSFIGFPSIYDEPGGFDSAIVLSSTTDIARNVEVCVTVDGATPITPWFLAASEISKGNFNYTLHFPEELYPKMYELMPSTNRMGIRYLVRWVDTYGNGHQNVSGTSCQFVIENARHPDMNPFAEVNNSTYEIVYGKSSVTIYVQPEAMDGAYVAEVKVENNGTVQYGEVVVFDNVTSGVFGITVKDSRGRTNNWSNAIQIPVKDFVTLTCNFERIEFATDGTFEGRIFGNFHNGTIEGTQNSVSVGYLFGEVIDDNTINWQDNWTWLPHTKIGDTYESYFTIPDLDYRKTYIIEAVAQDLTTGGAFIKSGQVRFTSRPIFDWSSKDFNFNVPVTITDGYQVFPIMGLFNAMTKAYNCQVSVDPGANYIIDSATATIVGNNLRCYFNATRTTASATGNITNETVCRFSIYHASKIAGMLHISFINGGADGLASFQTANSSQTEDTLDFTVTLTATHAATTNFSAFFSVPITLRLEAFVD